MSRLTRILLTIAAILIVLAIFYRQQISRFLFHPEGLSTAASEICLSNESGVGVVAEITVENGASSTTFLAAGEEACSASPDASLPGTIVVGIEEGAVTTCTLPAMSGDRVRLELFDAPDNCEWSQ